MQKIFVALAFIFLLGCVNLTLPDNIASCQANGDTSGSACSSILANDTQITINLATTSYGCNEAINYMNSTIHVSSCPFGKEQLQLSALSGTNLSDITKTCDTLICTVSKINNSQNTLMMQVSCNKVVAQKGNLYFVSISSPAEYTVGQCTGFNPPFQNCTSVGNTQMCQSFIEIGATKS